MAEEIINHWVECDTCGRVLFSDYVGEENAERLAEEHRKEFPGHIVWVGPDTDSSGKPRQEPVPRAAS